MARITVVKITCDRCEKDITDLVREESGDGELVFSSFLSMAALNEAGIASNEARMIKFSDVCPSCVSRIDSLMSQIWLRKKKVNPEDSPCDEGEE